MSRRAVAAVLIASVLSVAALGWVAWIVADPSYWFPGAYAEEGERGPRGPTGPSGPVGPPGPVGPDAEETLATLSSDLEDVAARVDDLEGGVGTSDLQTEIDELQGTIESIRDELFLQRDVERYARSG